MNEIARNNARKRLSIKPEKVDAHRMNVCVRLGLSRKFYLSKLTDDEIKGRLYQSFSDGGFPPRSKEEIEQLWDNPVEALLYDADLFYDLPRLLKVPAQIIYTGTWLVLWDNTFGAPKPNPKQTGATKTEQPDNSLTRQTQPQRDIPTSPAQSPVIDPSHSAALSGTADKKQSTPQTTANPLAKSRPNRRLIPPPHLMPPGKARVVTSLGTLLHLSPAAGIPLSDRSIFDDPMGDARSKRGPQPTEKSEHPVPRRPQGMILNTHEFFKMNGHTVCCYERELRANGILRCTEELAKGSKSRCLEHLGYT